MSKKVGLIIGVSLIVVGIGISVITMASKGFNFSQVYKTVKVLEEKNATVEVGSKTKLDYTGVTADITVSLSSDEKIHLNYDINEYEDYDITESSDSLNIQHKYLVPWYQRLFNYSQSPKFEIKLPASSLKEIDINNVTGSVTIDGLTGLKSFDLNHVTGDVLIKNTSLSDSIEVNVTTGKVEVNNCTMQNLILKSVTGEIKVNNVIATQSSKISGTTSAITSNSLDSAEITINVTNGEVTTHNTISDKIKITTVTGEIDCEVKGNQADYKVEIDTTSGDCNIVEKSSGSKQLDLETVSGDINVSFID